MPNAKPPLIDGNNPPTKEFMVEMTVMGFTVVSSPPS